jgi:hypothetical protein
MEKYTSEGQAEAGHIQCKFTELQQRSAFPGLCYSRALLLLNHSARAAMPYFARVDGGDDTRRGVT